VQKEEIRLLDSAKNSVKKAVTSLTSTGYEFLQKSVERFGKCRGKTQSRIEKEQKENEQP